MAVVVAALGCASPALAASQHLGQRVLRPGMSGHDVRVLQQYLGFSGFPTSIDGQFGPTTEQQVMAFEHRFRLRASGVVNRFFVSRIRAVVADKQGTAAVANSTGGASYAASPSQSQSSEASSPNQSSPSAAPAPAGRAQLVNGLAVAPSNAPQVVKDVIAAANRIATTPYYYGGGHNPEFAASGNPAGYDCSGSTSYALHGGSLLASPEDSTGFESYGSTGAGRWITLWANGGHVYMNIAGLWFDTAAQSSSNGDDRWSAPRIDQASGYIERHPTGY
jgi:peptidoglycan hydrolase-like protein with peptidoglycan-binding domain